MVVKWFFKEKLAIFWIILRFYSLKSKEHKNQTFMLSFYLPTHYF